MRPLLAGTLWACATGLLLGCVLGTREPRLPHECATLAACRSLRDKAVHRWNSCSTQGRSNDACDDLRDDMMAIEDALAKKERVAEEAEAERRRRENVELDRQQVADQRDIAQRKWELSQTIEQCKESWKPSQCDVLLQPEKGECKTECLHAIKDYKQTPIYKRALRQCEAASGPAAARTCTFVLPEGAEVTMADRQADCDEACVRIARRAEDDKREEEAERRRPKCAAGASVKCCDGVLSPTCSWPPKQGCCSHHRGVCGCTM